MARIMDALADDKDVITYRPALRTITKSALGAIFLQQVLHRAKNNKWKPFYKFAHPCEHSDYAEGDSWIEELGFSENEFETARGYISSKITSGQKRNSLVDALVFFWTDSNRKTWYEVNQSLIEKLLNELYDDECPKDGIRLYQEKRFPAISKKRRNVSLHDSESTESTEIPPSAAKPEIQNPAEEDNYCEKHKLTYVVECGLCQFEKIESASKHISPREIVSSAGVADPTLERNEQIRHYADAFAIILNSGPTKEQKSAARRMIDEKWYRENRTSVDNLLRTYRNGKGAQFRKDGQSAYFILTALERDLAKGKGKKKRLEMVG